MRILITGCAGFIGSHTCERLLKTPNNSVLGVDNLNDYYDVSIKLKNLDILRNYKNFSFQCDDICDTTSIERFKPQKIIHLASMAGVRNSIKNPFLYEKINIGGFIHILEEAVKHGVKNVVYASSSSVYGLNKKVPFSESDAITSCNSPYACSKMAMETFAKTYSQLHNIPTIGLRFFTVYGPRGRPDMAPYKFLNAINKEVEFDKFGNGETSRDYTYIDDIVDGIIAALNKDTALSEIYNLGNSNPISLNGFIKLCEEVTNKKAKYKTKNMQLGDVPHTYADITKANEQLNYSPKVTLKEGLIRMNEWIVNSNEE